ncbi:hypothetical protein ACFV9C_41630 [Kribbella sp. NPDC059898]|uniref:hypothetical protein n=1 Tax=Kribbella sp. NPDC059898 TaxID=3346995 RepID=UPI00365A47C1
MQLVTTYDERQLYLRVIEQGLAGGLPVDILEDALEQLPEFSSLDTLETNRHVADRLTDCSGGPFYDSARVHQAIGADDE